MKIDVTTVRLLSRVTDRMDLIRKHPHRYDIEASHLEALADAARHLEQVLTTIRTIKAG